MFTIITARGLFTFKDSSHGHWRQEILKIQQTTNPAAFNIYEVKIKLGRTAITHTELRGTSYKVDHPLYALLRKVKQPSSVRLRSQARQLPRINTERFKNCYFNRIRFKYNLAIKQCRYPMFYQVLHDSCK